MTQKERVGQKKTPTVWVGAKFTYETLLSLICFFCFLGEMKVLLSFCVCCLIDESFGDLVARLAIIFQF